MQVYESKTAPDEIKVAVLITLVRAHAAMHACGSPNYSHGVCALAVQVEKKEIQEKLSLLGKLCWEKFEVARGREEGRGRGKDDEDDDSRRYISIRPGGNSRHALSLVRRHPFSKA